VVEAHYIGDVVHFLNRNVPVAREALRWGSALALESFETARRYPGLNRIVVALASGYEGQVEELRDEVGIYDPDLEDHDVSALVATCWRCAAEGRLADDSDITGLVTREGLTTYELSRVPGDVQAGPLLSALVTLFQWYARETERPGTALVADLRSGMGLHQPSGSGI
jgi:hypothetical protein